MADISFKRALELAADLRSGKIGCGEMLEHFWSRGERFNPALNAIVTIAPDVLEHARQAEVALMRGDDVGTLHGVPITVKDTIETAGLRVILDGVFSVEIDGEQVAELGPGAIVGERAALEGGRRTATLTATTPARVAVFDLESADRGALEALATSRRESS